MSSSILKGAAIAASATVFALVVVQAQPGCDGEDTAKEQTKAADDDKKDAAPAKAESDAKAQPQPGGADPDPTHEAGREADAPTDASAGTGGEVVEETKAEPETKAAAPKAAGNAVPERKFFPASKAGVDFGIDKPAAPQKTPEHAPNPPPQPAPNAAPNPMQQAGG